MNDISLPMSLEDIEDFFRERMDEGIKDLKKEIIKKGIKNTPMKLIWITIEKEWFRECIRLLCEIQIPHLSVTSGSDIGDFVELIYHFQINYGYPNEETTLNIKVHLPKDDLTIPTITDLVPGAITTEREKQEFLGVKVIDIPDSRRLWLDENYPEDRHPWRWDEKGMEEMSRYIHDPKEASDKPTSEKAKDRLGGE
ncbi:MAG: NADH-quinone oxidoreductase subunit C [Thermoplasmatota archaeon]